MILLIVFSISQLARGQDVTVYEGDGFSFAYPVGWFVEVDEDGATVKEIEGDTQYAGMSVSVGVGDLTTIFAESESELLVEGDVSVEFLSDFFLGTFFGIDAFVAGFAGDVRDVTLHPPVEVEDYRMVGFDGQAMRARIVANEGVFVFASGPWDDDRLDDVLMGVMDSLVVE